VKAYFPEKGKAMSDICIRAIAHFSQQFPHHIYHYTMPLRMSVGRIFCRGAVGDFPKIFSRGEPKVVKFGFYPSKLKKQPFLLIITKSRGGKAPPSPHSDAHAFAYT